MTTISLELSISWLYSKENLLDKIKTLTAEEAINFIAKQTNWFILHYKKSNIIKNSYNYMFKEILKDWSWGMCLVSWNTLLQSIEEMLEYLLDNNMLWKH